MSRIPFNPLATNMSLRDHFAAKAMQGLLHDSNTTDGNWDMEADAAYEIANAMLMTRRNCIARELGYASYEAMQEELAKCVGGNDGF